jgi:hypothetical protein
VSQKDPCSGTVAPTFSELTFNGTSIKDMAFVFAVFFLPGNENGRKHFLLT